MVRSTIMKGLPRSRTTALLNAADGIAEMVHILLRIFLDTQNLVHLRFTVCTGDRRASRIDGGRYLDGRWTWTNWGGE